MDDTKQVIPGDSESPPGTTSLVKWNPSFAIGVSRAVYSAVTQMGTGVKKSFSKEKLPVDSNGQQQVTSGKNTTSEDPNDFVEKGEGEEPPSPLTKLPVDTNSQQQVTTERDITNEVLYDFVENWEGEEPPSPLLFDPDGDFIILPRPTEDVPIEEASATSSATLFPYVYIHSGLLTGLQAVTSTPQNVQKYLKQHLHLPHSKNSSQSDVCTSDISSNVADSVSGADGDSDSKDKIQEVGRTQDKQKGPAIKEEQEEKVIDSGAFLQTDVVSNSTEGQVSQPQRSPKRLLLPSIRSPLAFRRNLNQSDQVTLKGRETPLTGQSKNDEDAAKQAEGSIFRSVEKEVVLSIPEEASVLQIPIEPSEGQVLIPKPVEKHLSWIPLRPHFSFRRVLPGGSGQETHLTDEREVDAVKETQPLQSAEGGEVISVPVEPSVTQNPAVISEGEVVVAPSSSLNYFSRIQAKTSLPFRKTASSESRINTGQEISSSEINPASKTFSQSGAAEPVDNSSNVGETETGQIPLVPADSLVTVPLSSPAYLNWIPVTSPFRWRRPPSSGGTISELSKQSPTVEFSEQEKALDNPEETHVKLIPLNQLEGDTVVPPLSNRPSSWIPRRSPFTFYRQPANVNVITEEAPAGEIDAKEKPVDYPGEGIDQIPNFDLSEGQILVPQSHFVPESLPFAVDSNLGSEPGTERQGEDSCETGVDSDETGAKEEPNQSLGESPPLQGYWKQFPVKWLSPEKYRLLVANTILRRREDLELLQNSAHFLESELLEPGAENVEVDFEELDKIFNTVKALKSIKSSNPGRWSFTPIIPALYHRYWRVPLADTSERPEQIFRRRYSSFSGPTQEPLEPFSQLEDSKNGKNNNFSEIHDSFKQFAVPEGSLEVTAPSAKMASLKDGGKARGGSIFRSLRNMVWTGENGHVDQRNADTPVPPANEERIDIAPSETSQQRVSQLYQPNQDKNQITKEWTDTREDLEDFIVTETHSLSGGLDFRKPEEQSKPKDTFSSYFSRKCSICEEYLTYVGFFMRRRQDYECKQCKHLFCRKCQVNYLQGGECRTCRQDITKQNRDISSLGTNRSYTDNFKQFRNDFTKYGMDLERHQEQFRFHPTIGSVLRQCRRLMQGYKKCLDDKTDPNKMQGGGLLKRGVPEWQKPPTWIDAATKEVRGCQLCSNEWFVDSLHNCRLCGRRVCSQDSSRDFMLYIPDQNTVDYSPTMKPHWSIIRVVGCPSEEPVVKLYLRICFTCKNMLETHQEKKFTLSHVTISPDYIKCEQIILDIHQETQKMKENIQDQLPQLVKMVDSFSADSKNISESDKKSLVKHQDDLMDQFPRYIIAVDKLREISPQTEQQVKLVRSLMQEKRSFYRDNVIAYRVAGKQLSEIMPKEEIEHRLKTVNFDAINCACIVISQLAYEVLRICVKYNIPEELAVAIREVSEICEGDLKKMIEQKEKTDLNETWENHKRQLLEFVKAEMKSDRRYLKVDPSGKNRNDLKLLLKKETHRRIRSTLIQLRAKSASRAFSGTKEALENLQTSTQM